MFKRIDLRDQEYPPLLRTVDNPPESIFVRGSLPNHDTPMVAIVGSRECSIYGRRVATEFAKGIVKAGMVVVSGLAFGVDTAAHEATVGAGGRTIAVLGSGVDRITPANNKPLAERILDHDGAIVSQFPPGTPGYDYNFPIRNEVIAGLCIGTVIVEASTRSGALITARKSNDFGREVFVVPGAIDSPTSQGTNALLKSMGHIVTSVNDVLDVLSTKGLEFKREAAEHVADTKEEAILLPLLNRHPKHLDQIIRESGLLVSLVNTSMTMMEIKGKVRHVGGNHYIIS